MKINLGKLSKVLLQLITAAPAIVVAVKPVLAATKAAPSKIPPD